MRCVALHHWKSLAAKYTRKLNAVERVFETRYKQENISDVTIVMQKYFYHYILFFVAGTVSRSTYTSERFQIQYRLRIQNQLFYEYVTIYESMISRGEKNEWDFSLSLSRSSMCCKNTKHLGMF